MHATRNGRHLSGAERMLEQPSQAENELLGMFQRALQHPRGRADHISLKVEEVAQSQLTTGCLLDVSGFQVESWEQGRQLAQCLLAAAGVAPAAAIETIDSLSRGAAPDGCSMRGAMLVDAVSGERLEPDRARGVRVSRMDISATGRQQLQRQLATYGLNRPQVVEALVLASKVLAAPGVIAELCWSDDPDYTTGYVSSANGYQRISPLKPAGEERGGRAFFISPGLKDVSGLVDYLENRPYLIDRIGHISEMRSGVR